jgi:apolipoprotein N-acyltransferase
MWIYLDRLGFCRAGLPRQEFLKRPLDEMKQLKLKDFIALIAGALLPLAFAPVHISILDFVGLTAFFACIHNASPRRAAWRGFLFGVGQFGVGISWVYVSIHVYGEAPWPFAALLTALFVIVLALFPMLFFYGAQRFKLNPNRRLLGLYPVAWVLSEMLRGHLFTGFPWLLLGYSQTTGLLKPWLPVVGVFGVSFLIAFISAAFIYAWYVRDDKKRLLPIVFVIIFLFAASFTFSKVKWTLPEGKPIKVSLLQGNIAQQLKWSPAFLWQTLNIYQTLINQNWQSDLIVLPEAALPLARHQAGFFLHPLNQQARKDGKGVIVGIPIELGTRDAFYNALIGLGDAKGVYHKRRLVPFGEFVPFDKWLRGVMQFFNLPMSTMVPGRPKQALIRYKNLIIAPFICYEIAYGGLLQKDFPPANILLTASNDAWFGDSFAPAQHAQIAAARAIETGRYLMLVANNGVTAIVAPTGQLQLRLPQFQQGALSGDVQAMIGFTPWLRYGNWPLWLVMLLILTNLFARHLIFP